MNVHGSVDMTVQRVTIMGQAAQLELTYGEPRRTSFVLTDKGYYGTDYWPPLAGDVVTIPDSTGWAKLKSRKPS